MCLRKRIDEKELPIYEVRGNLCNGIVGETLVKNVSFKRIRNFLEKE